MRFVRPLFLVSIALSVGALVPSPSARADNGKKVTFMTRNLYLGGDLAPTIGAVIGGDPVEIAKQVGIVWGKVQFTNFPARAKLIADEIKTEKPDFVGLEECVTWKTGAPLDPAPADHVVYDYLATLLAELAARGEHYEVAAAEEGFTAEFTGVVPSAPDGLLDISLHDRDVLLVRKSDDQKITNAGGFHFAVNTQFPTPTGLFTVTRGWCQADVTMGGRKFRVVTTHLDSDVEIVREIQASEILAGPCATTLPVVLIGDMNSDGNGGADGVAYQEYRAAGFADAWLAKHPSDAGITWGHDELLHNPVPFTNHLGANERIDFVLYKGGETTDSSDRVGEAAADFKGIWPSDHAGVVATLRMP